ncbi:MAG: hypothetical protein JJU33_06380 [Phycisphaerales bacterium]|nr:hypothetical protein [Phycisphaerales bacterium]
MHRRSTKTDRSTFGFSRGVAAIAAAFLVGPAVASVAHQSPYQRAAADAVSAADRFKEIFREHTLWFTLFDNSGIGLRMRLEPNWAPGGAHSGMLDSMQPLISALIGAAALPPAHWGDDAVDVAVLEVRYWLQFYTASTILAADARRLGAEGETQAAAERLGAIIRSARHISEIRHLRSAEAAENLLRFAADEAELLMSQDGSSEPERAILRAALASLDPDDPVGFEGVFENQLAMALAFLRLRDGIADGNEAVERAKANAERTGLTPEVLTPMQAETYFNELAEVWDSPRRQKGVDSMKWREELGEFGARWTSLTPHPLRYVLMVERAQEHIGRLRALTGSER